MGIEELMLDRAKKQGIKTGIEKGIKTGIEKGKKEGERKKAIEAAKKMKKSGFESSIISDIVGLSIEEVEKL